MKKKLGVFIIVAIISMFLMTNILFAETQETEYTNSVKEFFDKYNMIIQDYITSLRVFLLVPIGVTGIISFKNYITIVKYSEKKITVFGIAIPSLIIAIVSLISVLGKESVPYLGLPVVAVSVITLYVFSLLEARKYRMVVIGGSISVGFITIVLIYFIIATAYSSFNYLSDINTVYALFTFNSVGVLILMILSMIQSILINRKIENELKELETDSETLKE